MKVLISIKPEFAFKIFDGSKKFEFRKIVFKKKGIKKVVVYASYPVQLVIGEFEIDSIISLQPEILWKKTKKFSGISEDFFFSYFNERNIGHAIKIKNTKKYLRPLCIKADFNKTPPQSYTYISA